MKKQSASPSGKGVHHDPVKLLELLLAVFFILAIGILSVGFFPVTHPRFSRETVIFLKKNGIDSCAVGSVHVRLWKGIEISDMLIKDSIGQDGYYSLFIKKISCSCTIFRIFYGQKQLVETLGHYENCGDSLKKTSRVAWFIKTMSTLYEKNMVGNLDLTGVSLMTGTKNTQPMVIKGMDLALRLKKETPVAVGLTFKMDSTAIGDMFLLKRARGECMVESNYITLSRCKAAIFDGEMRAEAIVDYEKEQLTIGSLSLQNSDLSHWNRFQPASRGVLAGRGTLRLTLDSSALDLDSLRGNGVMTAVHLSLSDFPFQKSLAAMLLYPGFGSLYFKKAKNDFTLKPARHLTTDAVLESDSMKVKVQGWMTKNGSLNESVDCTLSKEMTAGLPSFAQNTLEETPDGGRKFKCRIYGTASSPKFELESKEILRKAVNVMFEDVKNNFGKWLQNR